MHQFLTPSLSQTIWPRWASRQFLSLPIVPTLLVTFGYSLSSLWDNWGDERGCDEGHRHANTRGLWWDIPEVVGTVQRVDCSRRRLLRRGLEFHVFTINKSDHTKKSLEIYLMILVYIYIYIYIWHSNHYANGPVIQTHTHIYIYYRTIGVSVRMLTTAPKKRVQS